MTEPYTAAEIESLRGRLPVLYRGGTGDTLDRLLATVDALEAANEKLKGKIEELAFLLDAEEAENEKLREALRAVEPFIMVPSDTYPQHYDALAEARILVREALRTL